MLLTGLSPRARGDEKTRIALDWLYRWGWSSPSVLDLTTGGTRSNLVQKLIKNQLVKSTRTQAGGGIKGVPSQMLTLTSFGIEQAEARSETLIPYEIDPYRINQSLLRHDEIMQRATAQAIKNKIIINFKTPRELAIASEKEIKQPDAIWIENNGARVGIEVELSAKWERKLDQFVRSCLTSLLPNSSPTYRVDKIYLISDSKAIIKRYDAAFEPGQLLTTWEKDERGIWKIKEKNKVPEWAEGKIVCHLIE